MQGQFKDGYETRLRRMAWQRIGLLLFALLCLAGGYVLGGGLAVDPPAPVVASPSAEWQQGYALGLDLGQACCEVGCDWGALWSEETP